ncbi:MAG: hypothetical protein NC489_08120 [Ruminococcus flavefaciens]|nr:hypothetical protein [Ruminococcus flavefaciens]
MEIIVGSGMYYPVRAFLIKDPNHIFFAKHVIDYSMNMLMNADHPFTKKAKKEFEAALQEAVIDTIPMREVQMNMERTYGCPGYFYIQSSLAKLRQLPYGRSIYMELDNQFNRRLSIITYPRDIGYSIDVPASLSAAAIADFMEMEQQILVMMPGINTPNDVDIPEYVTTGSIRFTTYNTPQVEGTVNG